MSSPSKKRKKKTQEEVREGRNIHFVLRNVAPFHKTTSESVLSQRMQLRQDLRNKKKKKRELFEGEEESPVPTKRRKGTPRKIQTYTEPMVVSIARMSMDSMVDQFFPIPEEDSKPDAKDFPPKKESFKIQVQLVDDNGKLLEEHPLSVRPNTSVALILTQFVLELDYDDEDIKEQDLEASFQNNKLLERQSKVASLGLKKGSILTVTKKPKAALPARKKSPIKRPAKEDPFLESSDEEDDDKKPPAAKLQKKKRR